MLGVAPPSAGPGAPEMDVPVASPFLITLSDDERTVLTASANSACAAADGVPNAGIAADLGLHVDTVRKWRRRFASHGVKGLDDLPRSGRPRTFTPVQTAELKALACELPAESSAGSSAGAWLPLSRWSVADLAAGQCSAGS